MRITIIPGILKRSILFSLIMTALLSSGGCNKYQPVMVKPAPGELREKHEAVGEKYMIVTQGEYATRAGEKMFALGGNIADAALAVSFVISVERPQSTGLGGGGFLLYGAKDLSEPVAYDFRERAPAKAKKKMYLDKEGLEIPGKSLTGIFAAGTPGLVDGLLRFHRERGKLPLTTILQPAIELARNGFKVYRELARALEYKKDTLARFPASKAIFFRSLAGEEARVLREGEQLVQTDLANTLSHIATKGRAGFYRGDVAQAILRESGRRGGLLTSRDLREYKTLIRRPVKGKYRGYTIYSMSPPSSGGIHILQILGIVEKDKLRRLGPHHPKSVHLIASAMQQAFADRATHLGDPDFVDLPVQDLLAPAYLQSIRAKIPGERALTQKQVHAGEFTSRESDHTTHFSIMDNKGNVVVSTQTINGLFGSSLVVPGTGIILNNEMDDFATRPGASNLFGAVGGTKNLVEPGKRPLSSMSPTIVYKNKEPVLALGTPSGTRILTCVAQTILNYIEFQLPLYESVALARYHHQWSPDELRVGKSGLPPAAETRLKNMGYKLNHKNLGCRIQAIARENNILRGVSDPRGPGAVSRGGR